MMKQQVIVIGAGIIGASIAYQLAKAGAAVTVLDAGGPAGQASGASFGWINASFYVDPDHFALRLAGIEAHERLARSLNTAARMPK
jgi:glycine/D-amino acid oxidase-like deaminating enzyme